MAWIKLCWMCHSEYWSHGTIWQHGSVSILAQVKACFLMAQAISWTIVDLSWPRCSNIQLKAVWQEIHQPTITKTSLKITYPEFQSNLPGAKELSTNRPGMSMVRSHYSWTSGLPLCKSLIFTGNIHHSHWTNVAQHQLFISQVIIYSINLIKYAGFYMPLTITTTVSEK